MIAWRYEFLRSAYRFLGDRCLNLSLMDEFQAFVLSLLIEGCEVFCSVLEHVTEARATGELHGSHLPIYHGIVLLQPHITKDK